jgi:hypothetical protein
VGTTQARPEICHYCRRPVIWCSVVEGKRSRPIEVEPCQPGRGNIALVFGLFGGAPLAELVGNGTAYRAHREHCTSRSAGAPSFSRVGSRKQRPLM